MSDDFKKLLEVNGVVYYEDTEVCRVVAQVNDEIMGGPFVEGGYAETLYATISGGLTYDFMSKDAVATWLQWQREDGVVSVNELSRRAKDVVARFYPTINEIPDISVLLKGE